MVICAVDEADRIIHNQQRRTYWHNNPSYSKHHNERHVERDHEKLCDVNYKQKRSRYNRNYYLQNRERILLRKKLRK